MQKTILLNENVSLSGFSVFFPSACVGNAAQLAADLLISTLQMRKVASVWHSGIIPILGPRAFQHQLVSDASSPSNNITTACELYVCESKRLACFQLRSPLVPGEELTSFFKDLTDFLARQQVRQFIVLTGMFSHEQHAIGTSKFMYIANEQYQQQHKSELEKSNWVKRDEDITIHGGGFAMKLYKQTKDVIPSCMFVKYTAEGDNRIDAVEIVQQLDVYFNNALLEAENNDKIKLIFPISWKALYGNDPPQGIY